MLGYHAEVTKQEPTSVCQTSSTALYAYGLEHRGKEWIGNTDILQECVAIVVLKHVKILCNVYVVLMFGDI